MKARELVLLTIFTLVVSLWPVKADGPHDTPKTVGGNTTNSSDKADGIHDIITATSDANNGGAKEVRQWEITGPWGGDVRSLVAAPDDSNLFYLGTSDGQIFCSKDGTRTWHRLKPGLGERGLSIDSIVIDPHDSRVIYVGAWAVALDVDGGVFKSEDAGEHWKLLSDTKKLSVRSLAIAPSDSKIILAGSANDDPKLNGTWRSTDAGHSWQRISPEGDKEIHNIESIAIHPNNPEVIYVGTWHLPWKTTDGGVTWKRMGYKETGVIDDSDIFGITVDPGKPDLMYLNACSGIYRSTSAGDHWLKVPGIPFTARRTYYLLPHPSNPNVVFAGTSEGLWRTKDGGKRWMLLTSKSHVIRAIVITPDKPNRVLVATDDYGVITSDNLGDDFADANTGFIHRHILSILPDAQERGRLLASVFHDGSAGSIFASRDGGETWQSSSRGLGSRDVFAFYQMPDDPNIIYVGTNTGVFRSNDHGSSWSYVGKEQAKPEKPVKKPVRRRRASVDTNENNANPASRAVGRYQTTQAAMMMPTPAAPQRKKSTRPAPKKEKKPVAPVEPLGPAMFELTKQVDDITSFTNAEGRRGLLAATMDGLYRTFDETRGWEKVNLGGYDPNGRVYSVSTHKDLPKRILAGTKSGLYISDDGGEVWTHVDRGPADMSINSIAQPANDPQTILLGTNQNIFRSTNGGRTWVRRGGGLPSGDYTSVVFNPANPDEVMVAEYSKGGIYRSSDKGYSWERLDSLGTAELPTTRVWTLSFDPFERDRVYAGSFSSGVYVLTFQKGVAKSSQ